MGSGIHCLAAYVTFGNAVVKSNNATRCCVFAGCYGGEHVRWRDKPQFRWASSGGGCQTSVGASPDRR